MSPSDTANGNRGPDLYEREVKALEAIATHLKELTALARLSAAVPDSLKVIAQQISDIAMFRRLGSYPSRE